MTLIDEAEMRSLGNEKIQIKLFHKLEECDRFSFVSRIFTLGELLLNAITMEVNIFPIFFCCNGSSIRHNVHQLVSPFSTSFKVRSIFWLGWLIDSWSLDPKGKQSPNWSSFWLRQLRTTSLSYIMWMHRRGHVKQPSLLHGLAWRCIVGAFVFW